MIYLISQIIVLISFIISIAYGAVKVSRKTILFCELVINILYGTHNLLLGATTGAVMNFIALIVLVIYYYKGKNKVLSSNLIPLFAMLTFMTAGLLSWNNIYSLFPMIGAMLFALAMWFDSEKDIKVVVIILQVMWLLYAISNNSIVAIIGQSFIVLSLTMYLILGDKYKKITSSVNAWFRAKFGKKAKLDATEPDNIV